METSRRASLADEEAHQIRAVELVAGASRSRDVAIEGQNAESNVADKDTIEDVQNREVEGYKEPDTPTC